MFSVRSIRRTTAGVVTGTVGFLGLPAIDARAAAQTPEAMAAMRGLRTFAVALDQLADTPRFATKVPLTERSVADLLGFPGLFTKSLGNGLAGFSGDYSDLATAINAADSGSIDVSTSGVTVNGDVATFVVSVTQTTVQDVRISYVRPAGPPEEAHPQAAVVMHGGGASANTIPITASMTASLPFRVDKSVLSSEPGHTTDIDELRAVSFDPTSASLTMSTASTSENSSLSFTARYGFTDVSVTGSAAVRLTGSTAFSDPDASGLITQGEWLTTLLPDWAAFTFGDTPGVNDLAFSLSLDSNLTGSGSDGTITYTDSGPPTYVDLRSSNPSASAPTAPTVALSALEPFTRVGADDALTGLSQFAATLSGAQARIDEKMPLLNTRPSDAFSPAGQLQDLVEKQGSAAITCGKADTQPPTGADLEGTTWYCQAVTNEAVSNVRWHRTDGLSGAITNDTASSTVGTAPTSNITITGVVGEPQVSVDFDVTQTPEGGGAATTATFHAVPRVRSAQELAAALDALTGSTITTAYDATKQALTFRVQISSDPASEAAGLDVGDSLRLGTGLSGLTLKLPSSPTDTDRAPVDVDFGTIALDATYGLLLTNDVDGIVADSLNGQSDRYFMKTGSGAEVSVADADVDTPSGMTLTGTVGYLGVDAVADSWAVSKNTSGNPILSADVDTSTTALSGADGQTISNAMVLRLILDAADPIDGHFNLAFDASLDIAASGSLSSLTTGTDQATVDVEWHDFAPDTQPSADPNDAYDDYLKLYDILPLAEGRADGSTSATVLVDNDVDFLSAFGHTITAGHTLDAQLINVTTGATCTEVTVTDSHTLTCTTSTQVDSGDGTATTKNGMVGGERPSIRTGHASNGAPTFEDADGNTVTTATTEDSKWRAGDTWRVAGDPTALRQLLTENLYDIANRLDNADDDGYTQPLPMVGLSPKDLTPQFAKIRDIAGELGARVALAAQAPVWEATHTYTAGAKVRPATASNGTPPPDLLYSASAGTTGGTPPAWPSAVGGTVTDGTVTWTAVQPDPTPPATLQDWVSALDGELTAAVGQINHVALSDPDVTVDLQQSLSNGGSSAPHLQMTVTWDGTGTVDAPITMSLSPTSQLTLHGIADDAGVVGAVNVTTNSTATIRFAVPLSESIPSSNVLVRSDTGISSLTATASSGTVDFTGSVGSIAVRLGESAHLFGRHTPLRGTHTASSSLSGTITATTSFGIADSGSTAGTLVDNDVDFVALGVTTSATVTKGSNTCSPTAVATHTLTCALSNSDTWAQGNAWSLTQSANASVLNASGLSGQGFNDLQNGDVITSGSVTCTYNGGAKTSTRVSCPATGGSWTSGQSFTVRSGRILVDSARTGADTEPAGTRAFNTFNVSGIVPLGTTVTRTTSAGGSCTISTFGTTTATCTSALSAGGAWNSGDTYRLDLGDTHKVLVDAGRGFDTMGLVGRTVTNTTDNATCVVTGATKDMLVCATALSNSGNWDAGDYYDISGPATAKLNLASYTMDGADDEPVESYAASSNLAASPAGGTTPQSCTDSGLSGATAVTGDACAVLAAQLVDPTAVRGSVVSVSSGTIHLGPTAATPALNDTVFNETQNFRCVVSTVSSSGRTFQCPAPAGESWTANDKWSVDDGTWLGVLSFHSDLAGTSAVSGLSSAFTGAVAGDEPLQFSLLNATMALLRGYLDDAFDDTLAAEPLPLIGLDRSVGSHVLDGVSALEDELAQTAPPEWTAGQTMSGFTNAVADYVKARIDAANSGGVAGGLKILSPTAGSSNSTGVTVTLLCKTTPHSTTSHACTSSEGLENIFDLRVKATIGGDAATTPQLSKGCPTSGVGASCSSTASTVHIDRFDTGLPGMKFDGPSGLDARVGWSYDLDFGLARDVGPYLGAGSTSDPSLEVGASVALPSTSTSSCTLPTAAGTTGDSRDEGSSVTNPGFDADRCYQATIGLFQGVVFDGKGDRSSASDGKNADRTGLDVKATMDLSPVADSSGRISLDSLSSPDVEMPTFKANADGNVDLYFLTGITTSGNPLGTTLPSVQGSVHLAFGVNGELAAADADTSTSGSPTSATYSHWTEVSYDDLAIDAGSFINDFAGPIIAEVAKITKPFKAVADILMAPIPVLEQIAKMTGEKIGTLLDILEEAAGVPLSMVRSVISIIGMVDDFASRTASTIVGLGAWGTDKSRPGKFNLRPKDTAEGDCGKTVDGKKQSKNCKKSFKRGGVKYKQTVVQKAPCPNDGCTGKEMAKTVTKSSRFTKFRGAGITFPFMDDSSLIFGMLVGEDATLVRVDPGAFGYTKGLEYSFGPFMAGPVPVDISIGATIGLTAHFAMGYDTRGIQEMLKQSRDDYDSNALTDGIFIDDLDLSGTDVDEIQLTFIATIGASVSVSVFKVGLYGGVGITIGFDLVDPDNDGKLYIDEIEQFKDNPICLFKVQGLLDFFLGSSSRSTSSSGASAGTWSCSG